MGILRAVALRRLIVLPCIALLWASGCAAPPLDLESIAYEWFDALHAGELERVAQFDASAPSVREGATFHEWAHGVRAEWKFYEQERGQGIVTLDRRGYRLVRAAMLGRGTFWEVSGREINSQSPALRLRLNFGYGEVNFGQLPLGTTIYMMGHPLGTIHQVSLGRGVRHDFAVLEHLSVLLEFELTDQQSPPGDAPYKVRRAAWIEGTAEYRDVSWMF